MSDPRDRIHKLVKLMARFDPLRRLPPQQSAKLARHVKPALLRKGEILPAPGERGWLTYLVAGRVRLTDDRGDTAFGADHPRAGRPLFRIFGPNLYVLAETDCRLLRVDMEVLQAMLPARTAAEPAAPPPKGIETQESAPTDEATEARAAGLFQMVYRAFKNDQLPLPSLPDIAHKIRRAVDDPFVGSSEVARIISSDPSLSARIIQTSNSAFYRGTKPIASLKEAVNRVGLVATRNITVAFALRNLFKARSPATQKRMHQLYNHSVKVSALAHVIARRLGGFDAERALLGGLVHDIGLIPVLMFLDEHPPPPGADDEVERVMQRMRGMTGNMVLTNLEFDQELIDVAEGAEDWLRDPAPKPDLCDLILIAQAHSFFGSEQMKDIPPLPQMPAFNKLNLGEVDPRVGLRFLHEAQDEIRTMQELLGG